MRTSVLGCHIVSLRTNSENIKILYILRTVVNLSVDLFTGCLLRCLEKQDGLAAVSGSEFFCRQAALKVCQPPQLPLSLHPDGLL